MPKKRGGENLFQRNGTWYTRVEVRGRDIRRSLRTTVLAEAKARRQKMLKAAEHFRVYGEDRHLWKEAVMLWTKEGSRTLRPATLKRYLVSLGQVRGILDSVYVDEISTKTISRIASRQDVANATRRRDLTAVSVVLRWCIAKQWREDNPAKNWDRDIIKEKREAIVLPTDYDIDCVVAAAPGNFAQMIRWAQFTGMRQEECASLERAAISLPRAAAQLTRTKTNRPRSVPTDDRALAVFNSIPVSLNTTFVFWHEPGNRYANVASRFRVIVKKAVRNAQMEGRPPPRPFRFHDLRHWYAVDYLRRGGSIYTLQKILGHASLTTTEIYLNFVTPEEQLLAKRVGTKAGTGTTVFPSK